MHIVYLADDHPVVREGVKSWLELNGFTVHGDANDGFEMLADIEKLGPEVVLLDLMVPKVDGFGIAERLQIMKHPAKVIAFTSFPYVFHIRRMLKLGACGFISKHCPPNEIVNGIRTVMEGRTYFSKDVMGILVSNGACEAGNEMNDPISSLTEREFEVILKLANGMDVHEIARNLCLSEDTVRSHRESAMKNLAKRI